MILLEVKDLYVPYGAINAVKGMSFNVEKGEIVTLIGANGAGKSAILRTISGLEKANKGTISYMEKDITNIPPHKIVELGISHVPEGRKIFANLTVINNLKLGANLRKDADGIKGDIKQVFELFPMLEKRQNQMSGTLSGGEQQMLAVGRALMIKGELMLLDEPSMGLAPLAIENISNIIKEINRRGVTILLIEQNAFMALSIAHRAYVLETGNIVIQGEASKLIEDDRIRKAYLGA